MIPTGILASSGGGGVVVLLEDTFGGVLNAPLYGHTPNTGGDWFYLDATSWYGADGTNGAKLNGSNALLRGSNQTTAAPNQVMPDLVQVTLSITVGNPSALGVDFFYNNTRWVNADQPDYTGELLALYGDISGSNWRVGTYYESIFEGAYQGFVAGGVSGTVGTGSTPVTFTALIVYTSTAIQTFVNSVEITPAITRDTDVPLPVTPAAGNFYIALQNDAGDGAGLKFNSLIVEG